MIGKGGSCLLSWIGIDAGILVEGTSDIQIKIRTKTKRNVRKYSPFRTFVPANFDACSVRFLWRNSSYVTYLGAVFLSVESIKFVFCQKSINRKNST